jgi:anti-anti-sigma factor
MTALQIRVEERDQGITVLLSGELDMAEAKRLEHELLTLEQGGPRRIVLDLSQLTFLDSHGLAALLDAAEQAQRFGCELVLVPPPDPIMQILRITLLDLRFVWAESAADASTPGAAVEHA